MDADSRGFPFYYLVTRSDGPWNVENDLLGHLWNIDRRDRWTSGHLIKNVNRKFRGNIPSVDSPREIEREAIDIDQIGDRIIIQKLQKKKRKRELCKYPILPKNICQKIISYRIVWKMHLRNYLVPPRRLPPHLSAMSRWYQHKSSVGGQ